MGSRCETQATERSAPDRILLIIIISINKQRSVSEQNDLISESVSYKTGKLKRLK